MAKINFTNQQNQENLSSAVVSLGVLICLMITVVGIKLWWFKHRLSFERSSTQNGAAGGNTSAIIVPRRSQQQKYKKDRRYSQQIYESVEVHGVFRQKRDDDLEIQPTTELPPVRVRQLSDNTSTLILPPPRSKRRNQIHSTAFEDLEIVTPPLTTASSSDLTTIPEINTQISLTFEEFEKQFKLKELKAESSQLPILETEVIERPMPPLRLNRSSSDMIKSEKTQRHLKSSQSITMPEFQKVKEKKTISLSRPTEDLTKIDDYDEPKLFETLGERRPTGYIKYEEVDRDLQEQYENELNDWAEKEDHQFTDSGIYESLGAVSNFKVLKNDPDNQSWQYNFNKNSAEVNRIEDGGYKWNYQRSMEFVRDSQNIEKKLVTEYPIKEIRTTQFNKEFHRSNEAAKKEHVIKSLSVQEDNKDLLVTDEYVVKQSLVKEGEPKKTTYTTSNRNLNILDTSSLQENFDDQFTNWPQYEEKIETPKINVRKYNNQDLDLQISFEETDNNIRKSNNKSSHNRPTVLEGDWPESPELNDIEECQESFNNKFYKQVRYFITTESATNHEGSVQTSDSEGHSNEAIKQRRPTGFEKEEKDYSLNYTDDSDGESKTCLPFNQSYFTESVLPKEIDDSGRPQSESEELMLNERRQTEYAKSSNKKENYKEIKLKEDFSKAHVKFDQNTDFQDQKEIWDSEIKQRRPTGYIKKMEIDDSGRPQSESEELMLNEIRQTEYAKSSNKVIKLKEDFSKAHVKFDQNTDFQDQKEFVDSEIKQRRLTGYIKKMEMMDLTDEETEYNNASRFRDIELNASFNDNENNSPSLVKQRRPTGFMKKDDFNKMEKHVNFQINNEDSATSSEENEVLKQRRPTGVREKEAITKQVNFYLNQNSDEEEINKFENEKLKQRRPTGFVRMKEPKNINTPLFTKNPSNDDNYNNNFDDPLWLEMEKDLERDFSQNFEEEFAKIRHSYEVNEADFLERKDDVENLPKSNFSQTWIYKNSIENNGENFENSKVLQNNVKPMKSPQEIKTTFSATELEATTSILKDHKLKEEYNQKLRKSKVTFDFNADERFIPARKTQNSSEEDSDNDALNGKYPPTVPPQPMQRVTNINYKTETYLSIPTPISLFGSQTSQRDSDVEDSWSAIHKHRNLTAEFQNPSAGSKLSPVLHAPPKASSYRNPMAQLAIERAREVRADMDGFKTRSINDKKSEGLRRKHQQFLNLNNDNNQGTEA